MFFSNIDSSLQLKKNQRIFSKLIFTTVLFVRSYHNWWENANRCGVHALWPRAYKKKRFLAQSKKSTNLRNWLMYREIPFWFPFGQLDRKKPGNGNSKPNYLTLWFPLSCYCCIRDGDGIITPHISISNFRAWKAFPIFLTFSNDFTNAQINWFFISNSDNVNLRPSIHTYHALEYKT